jgi:hypothetical protein
MDICRMTLRESHTHSLALTYRTADAAVERYLKRQGLPA